MSAQDKQVSIKDIYLIILDMFLLYLGLGYGTMQMQQGKKANEYQRLCPASYADQIDGEYVWKLQREMP